MADIGTSVSGLRSTGDTYLATDERPKNFREAILWLDPNGMTPITAMSAKMRKETTDDPEFSWWEEVMDAKRATIDGSIGTTSGTLNLNAAAEADGVRSTNPARQFQVGDILQATKSGGGNEVVDYDSATAGAELVIVTGITDNDTITVTRDYGARRTTNLDLQEGDRLTLVGKAFGEGTTSPATRTSKPSKLVNYTQIFKTAFQVTNTARATRMRTGDPFENDRKRTMFTHAEALEQAVMWGVAKDDTGDAPVRLMGGLRWFLSSNVNVNVGAIDDDFFLDTLSPLFDFNAGGAGDSRICFLGNGALNAVQKVIRDSGSVHIQYQGKINFFGLKLLEYQIPQGTFFLKSHPLLNTDPIYKNSMFVLNGRGIIMRPLRGRDTKIQKEIQANDADLRKDQWLTETGMELQFERTQGYYSNIL